MRLLPLLLIGLTSGVALAQASVQPFMVGSRGFGTLQEAVNAIGDGEGTIRIAPGTYRECAVQGAGRIAYVATEPGKVIFTRIACEGKAALVLRGRGAQVHQFVLVDPATGRAMPNARYRLFLPDHTIAGKPPQVGETDSVIFGTTDSAGRTAKVRLPKRYAAARWVLNPVVGHGELGESFRLVDSLGGAPIEGHPYLVDVVGEYLFCGHSSAGGYTAYAQSRESRTVQLENTEAFSRADDAWCAGEGRAIADSGNTPGAPDLYTQYLGTLTANAATLSKDLQSRIARKLMSLAIAERDAARIDLALDLQPVPEDRLNSYGYELVNAGLRVERLQEHPDLYWNQFPQMDAERASQLPHTFSLMMRK